jgi:predicted RecB family nuclease
MNSFLLFTISHLRFRYIVYSVAGETLESPSVIVTSQIFEDYLKCPTKCWLRSRAEPATGNLYAEWTRAQNEAYLQSAIKYLLTTLLESDRVIAPTFPEIFKDLTWRFATDVSWRTRDLECSLQAVERVPSEGRGRPALFIPYRFEFANKLTKEHKLQLAFDAFLLSESIGREVSLGKIVHGDSYATLKVKTSAFAGEVRKRIKSVTALLAGNSPPEFLLNRHCGQCEFQTRCRAQAREKDELSLLSGMSEKDRKKLHGKGIFTVTQLSYTFRPRRRRREFRGKQEKYHHSLRALAIRENKIHAIGISEPKFEDTSVFLDVEGQPDRDFYYLIGMRVRTAEGNIQHSFWADDEKGEPLIWNDFLGVLSTLMNPELIHYGNYEKIFLKRMCERHGYPPEGFTDCKSDRSYGKPSFAHSCSNLFSDALQWIEGNRWIPWILLVGLSSLGARNDHMAESMGGIEGPRGEAGAIGLQPAGLRSP